MALLIFVTGRLVVLARDRVILSTLSATAESTAQVWYEHYFNHMNMTDDFAAQIRSDQVKLPLLQHADGFGNVFRFNLFDAHGRLVYSSSPEQQNTRHTHGAHGPAMPRASAQDGPISAAPDRPSYATAAIPWSLLRRIARTGEVKTQVSEKWMSKSPSEHYSKSYVPILDNGQIIGIAEIFVDISADRKTIFNAFKFFSWTLTAILTLASLIPISAISYSWLRMASMNRDLARARDKAKAAENVKSRFLANMSHEIRTPLTGVMGMAELLDETELNDEQRRYTTTILNSSSALLNIINDILDFSKIEAGKMTVVSEPFDLHNCVQDVGDLLFPAGHSKGVEVCVDFQKNLPAWVIGDEWRLRQCLLNIAGNAVKFTKQGHVMIRVAERPAGFFEISVCDTGVGIPAEKLEAIFREFEQVENTDTRSNDGTGLGLAITRRLLHLMGGEITAQSEEGKGSCFRMKLPLEPADPVPQNAIQRRAALFDPTALEGRTAIIVDDLEINRRILSARLESFGMKTASYGDADAALAAMKACGRDEFDVVISDHQMPGRNGVDLLKAVRATKALQDIPFIILSSCDLDQLCRELEGARVDLYLNKPVRTDLLFRGVNRALKQGPGETGGRLSRRTAAPSTPGKAAPAVSGADIRVCVAEDNRTNRLVIEKLLSGAVRDIRFWSNGQEAVDGYLEARPDIIFMDISMPLKGGLAATSEIRALERQHGLPPCVIIALTAHAMVEDRDRAIAAGMDGFLTKPIRRTELTGFLNEVAERLGTVPTRDGPDSAPRRA